MAITHDFANIAPCDDAAEFTAGGRLKFLREDSEYVEISREKYERLGAAVKEMNTPYHSAFDLVHKQIDEVLEKYDAWLQEKKNTKKAKNQKGQY